MLTRLDSALIWDTASGKWHVVDEYGNTLSQHAYQYAAMDELLEIKRAYLERREVPA